MDTAHYLHKFQQVVDGLDKRPFEQNGLELKVGVWMDSVALKIQKQAWLNAASAKPFEESVFFSVWINDQNIGQNKLYYNIHALKLRELSAYKIKSRDFAQAFRQQFKPFEQDWPNISINYGPLTLMEGWVNLKEWPLEKVIGRLAIDFIPLSPIIDNLLNERKI